MLDINDSSQVQSFMRMAQQKMMQPDEQEIEFKKEVGLLHQPKILARFYVGSVRAPEWTKEEPRYNDQVMIFIQALGERDCLTAIADETHIEKYPKEYELFQRNHNRRMVPLTSLPKATPGVLAAFEDLGVRSIDDLLAAKLPAYLEPYRAYAAQIKAVHDQANGVQAPKRRGRPPKVQP